MESDPNDQYSFANRMRRLHGELTEEEEREIFELVSSWVGMSPQQAFLTLNHPLTQAEQQAFYDFLYLVCEEFRAAFNSGDSKSFMYYLENAFGTKARDKMVTRLAVEHAILYTGGRLTAKSFKTIGGQAVVAGAFLAVNIVADVRSGNRTFGNALVYNGIGTGAAIGGGALGTAFGVGIAGGKKASGAGPIGFAVGFIGSILAYSVHGWAYSNNVFGYQGFVHSLGDWIDDLFYVERELELRLMYFDRYHPDGMYRRLGLGGW